VADDLHVVTFFRPMGVATIKDISLVYEPISLKQKFMPMPFGSHSTPLSKFFWDKFDPNSRSAANAQNHSVADRWRASGGSQIHPDRRN